ncbi:MAG: hypothetical protein LBP95_06535 [Deltaproteobacteria bacterium]|jgi:hypothetical protein|nr:hypothetical protein [Deltaproteobacteria bacterium]
MFISASSSRGRRPRKGKNEAEKKSAEPKIINGAEKRGRRKKPGPGTPGGLFSGAFLRPGEQYDRIYFQNMEYKAVAQNHFFAQKAGDYKDKCENHEFFEVFWFRKDALF